MEAPKRKVIAKVSSHNVNGHSTTPPTTPSISSPPQLVVRAKISSTARTRTTSTTSSSNHTNWAAVPNVNGALRPQAHATARRSPSPVKMRPLSPSKPQVQSRPAAVRAPPSKASALKPHADRTRHGSISSVLSLAPVETFTSTTSAPTTPLSRNETNGHNSGDPARCSVPMSGSSSLRIKSKVSGLAKPVPPSLSTILSPPSPSSSYDPAPSSSVTHPVRARAPTVGSRRASVTFSVSQSPTSQLASCFIPRTEQPQLVPLPTSPPTSALSFSSRSSTSASASASTSSTHSHTTSTGMTPPLSHSNHVRSKSTPTSVLDDNAVGGTFSSHDVQSPTSPHTSLPPARTLVARVRPGTTISGGRGRGWNSESSATDGRDLGSAAGEFSTGARTAELDAESAGESECSLEETQKWKSRPPIDEGVDDDVRAEAKSIRKIADLEITTRSLLTINAALEACKVRQAREIRELRRKLRETRLAMPPGRFRLLTEDAGGGTRSEEEESDDDSEGDAGEEADDCFKRVKLLVEDLLTAGRGALAAPATFVLSAHPDSDIPSPSSGSANTARHGLGIATGTRMDQSEVLGWDVGSGLGTDSGVGTDAGAGEVSPRRWKHGVAIGSRVLSPEEAKWWVEGKGESEENLAEDEEVEGVQGTEQGRDNMADSSDAAGSPDVGSDVLELT